MLKLILYEWKKLWKNASVLKILLLFWVLSGVIFQGELNQDKEAHQTYLEFHKATDNMTEKDAENWLLEHGSLTVESLKITLQALYNLHFLCQILCFYMYLFVIVWYTKRKKDFLSCI